MNVATSDAGRLLGLAGDVRVVDVEASALRGNALGDPTRRLLPVYVPPGFDPEGSRRYPVIYVLPGFTGSAVGMLAARPWERGVVEIADAEIVAGRMPPTLVVLVDGFTRLGGSQYVDSIHNGRYATYVARDVVAAVDGALPTLASEGGRAVVGKSSGGFGALHLVMHAPGVFGAVGAHSADGNFAASLPPAFAAAQRAFESYGGDLAAFVTAFERAHKRPQAHYAALEMLAYAAAYSPRSASAFDVDLPFDARSGAIREDVFARWCRFDPIEAALERRPELARLRLRYVDCGRRDEYALDLAARILVDRMRAMGLGVEHEEFDDDHRSVGYRYAESLPRLARVLESAA